MEYLYEKLEAYGKSDYYGFHMPGHKRISDVTRANLPYGIDITDIEGFFKAIDGCKGKVELVTGEGDRLNLKSKLSQYVSLATIFSNGEIPEMEIVAHEKEDIDRLISYMING